MDHVWILVAYSVSVTLLLIVCLLQPILNACSSCVSCARGVACFVRGFCDRLTHRTPMHESLVNAP